MTENTKNYGNAAFRRQALKIENTYSGALSFMRRNYIGMDMVENSEITAIAAAHVAADMLCLMRT